MLSFQYFYYFAVYVFFILIIFSNRYSESVSNHEAGEPDFFKINLNSSVTYDVNLKNITSEQHIYILQKNSDGTFMYW